MEAAMTRKRKSNDESPAKWLAALDAMKTLSDGWDSYSAPAPHSAAIENATELINEAAKAGISPEHVEPSALGGVGVTFSANSHEVVVEFYNNGSAHALLSKDGSEDMRTFAVSTNRSGYHKVIGEVRKHLYGEKTAI